MEETVPLREKKRSVYTSTHPSVAEARAKAEEAHQKWDGSGADDDRVAWKLAIDFLYQVYNEVEEKELEKKIRTIESTHGAQKYGEAWKVVNEVTGRKKTKEGQVSGNSPEERVTTWFTHFKNLLGNTPDVEDPDEVIPTIFEDLDIKDDLFTLDEYRKVKSSLKIGKAAGPDNLSSDQ